MIGFVGHIMSKSDVPVFDWGVSVFCRCRAFNYITGIEYNRTFSSFLTTGLTVYNDQNLHGRMLIAESEAFVPSL